MNSRTDIPYLLLVYKQQENAPYECTRLQILSIYNFFTRTNAQTIFRTWMDLNMADTSERRGF